MQMPRFSFGCFQNEKIKKYRFNDLKFVNIRLKHLCFKKKYDIIISYNTVYYALLRVDTHVRQKS